MRARRRWIVLLLVLVVLLVGGRWGLGWLKLYGPGILAGWLDPIGPTRQVAWQAGPEAPAAPPASRPPNVVVIVADDLGYNDLTFAGGGVAGGAVPTPRIDSLARDGVDFTAGSAAAGATPPADRPIDGVDLAPLARHEAPAAPGRPLFWRSGHYRSVVADGFKLQVAERPAKSWLFDLRSDPTEKVNLAESDPERVRRLEALLAAHDAEMTPPAWPALIEGPVAIDHPLGVPDGADDEYVYWAN